MGKLNLRNFFRYWLPVLVWMSLIFSASGDSASFQHTSRIIAPLLHWLLPNLSDELVHLAVVLVRKSAHVTEYAILAWLVWRLVRNCKTRLNSNWKWSDAVWTLLVVVLYAASDEFHQRFVPSREASVRDVLIDTSGGLLALLWLCLLSCWQQRWSTIPNTPAKAALLPDA